LGSGGGKDVEEMVAEANAEERAWRWHDARQWKNTVHARQTSICLPILHYLIGLNLKPLILHS
jgi:hypothetical protein